MRGSLAFPLDDFPKQTGSALGEKPEQGLEISPIDILLAHILPQGAELLSLQLAIVGRGDHEAGIDGADRGSALDVEDAAALPRGQGGADVVQDSSFVGAPSATAGEHERQPGAWWRGHEKIIPG